MAPVGVVLYHPALVNADGVLTYRRKITGELGVVPPPELADQLLR